MIVSETILVSVIESIELLRAMTSASPSIRAISLRSLRAIAKAQARIQT